MTVWQRSSWKQTSYETKNGNEMHERLLSDSKTSWTRCNSNSKTFRLNNKHHSHHCNGNYRSSRNG